MNLNFMKMTWADSIKANFIMSLVILALVGLLISMYMDKTSIKPEVVVIPPQVQTEMRVGWSSANKDYLESFGIYIATLVGNVTSSNVQFVVDTLSQFFDSGNFPEIRKLILSTAESRAFREAAASTKFEPQKVYYEAATNRVFVSGEMKTMTVIGAQNPHTLTYEMELKIVERRPVLFSLISYDGLEHHTTEWKAVHPDQNQQKE